MGLGKLINRSTVYAVSDTVTGMTATYTVVDNLGPDWPSSDPYRGGMSIPAAWRAALLRAGLISQVPWDAWRTPLGGGPEIMLTPRPLLLEQPAPPDTRMTTFMSGMLDFLWDGNAIFIIASRNASGWPTGVIPVPACNVSVRRITPYSQSPLPVGAIEYKIGNMTFGSQDLIHVKGPCQPGAVRGLGVLELHLSTLEMARRQTEQVTKVTQNGVPSGVLKSEDPDLEEADAARLKTQFMASQGTVAVLNATTDFQPLSWNPEQMQLVEARQMTKSDMELVFCLPPGWLGGMNSARQYSNIEQDAVNLLKFTLSNDLIQWEQTLSLAFPRGTQARADLDSILRADTLTRYQAHAIALASGFKTVDEVRAKEGDQPLSTGDDEAAESRNVVEMVQKVYLGVGLVLTEAEAREQLNRAGAGLAPGTPNADEKARQERVKAAAAKVAADALAAKATVTGGQDNGGSEQGPGSSGQGGGVPGDAGQGGGFGQARSARGRYPRSA